MDDIKFAVFKWKHFDFIGSSKNLYIKLPGNYEKKLQMLPFIL